MTDENGFWAKVAGYVPRVEIRQIAPGHWECKFPKPASAWHKHNRGTDRQDPPQFKLQGIPAGIQPGDQQLT